MGCHTWISVRNRELEEKIKNKNILRKEIKEHLNEMIDFVEKEINSKHTKRHDKDCEPGDAFTTEWYKEGLRYYNHLLYFVDKFSDSTTIKLWFRECSENLSIITPEGKCYSDSKNYHDPFRYYNYDQEYELKSLEETWEFITNLDNHCYSHFWDKDDNYLGQIEYRDWTDEQKNEVYNKIKEIFETQDEPFITFG